MYGNVLCINPIFTKHILDILVVPYARGLECHEVEL